MKELKIYQSIWGMERQHPDGFENSLDANLQAIRDAGFDGISVTYEDAAIAGHATEFLKAHGMTAQGMCLPTSVDALKPVLENAAKFGVDHIKGIRQNNRVIRPQLSVGVSQARAESLDSMA